MLSMEGGKVYLSWSVKFNSKQSIKSIKSLNNSLVNKLDLIATIFTSNSTVWHFDTC